METLISDVLGSILDQPYGGDDFVDKILYFVTVTVLFVFAFAVGLQEFVGTPIECWAPLTFSSGPDLYRSHINSYCWTHQLRFPDNQKDGFQDNKTHGAFAMSQPKPLTNVGTAFFRWVTMILILQACLFKMPNYLWQQMSASSGQNLERLRELVMRTTNAEDEDKMDIAADFLESWITCCSESYSKCLKAMSFLFCLGRRSCTPKPHLYVLIKFCNCLNIIGNFFLITAFLDITFFWKYGIVVLDSVFYYGDWQDPYNFPRLLICDFTFQGNNENTPSTAAPQTFQFQCTMNINLLLEKLFVLEWFWLIFLLVVTIFNFVSWMLRIFATSFFITTYVDTIPAASNVTDDVKRMFVQDYLTSDGVFVLRLLELNVGSVLVGDVVKLLWNRYLEKPKRLRSPKCENRNNNNNNKNRKGLRKRAHSGPQFTTMYDESTA